MKTTSNIISIYAVAPLGLIIGLSFPFIFILLDLKQLGLQLTSNNMYEVFKSQNIYLFSALLFPILFGTVGVLFNYTYSQNKKLIEQESYIHNVLNSMTDCILVCDILGNIQYANRIFYTLYSNQLHSTKDFLGVTNLDQINVGQIFELKLLNKNGDERSVNYTVSQAFINNSYIISIRDIEDLKRNENIIESQKAQLFEASKLSALGQMAAGFAHEINNPLAIINGKTMLSERELRKDEVNKEIILKNLETTKKMVTRITRIIKGLKNLSHSSKDDQPEFISIQDLVEDFVIMANLKLTGRDIDFKIDIESVKAEKIFCNPIQISQVLMNLFNNAMDAIEHQEKQWFSLVIERFEQGFKITMQDSGTGIPIEAQQKIFEPMFTTKEVGKKRIFSKKRFMGTSDSLPAQRLDKKKK